ncbi:unnamed protein product [Blepharisma stoltei]|uniref:Enoyl-CoA hydratase/isomerase family protein n=1 Tax=Blepharisma stoltei TaxID=1481888 RepID=A0AAU9JIC9_9CILI|nr:unnamed protein product [Blepharisma stoltei]
MSELVHEGNIFILYIPIGFTVSKVAEINSLLDIVESHEGPTALIITSKNHKIFSAGMDLKEILKEGGTAEAAARVFIALMKLYGRLLAFKVPTIGALNGHTIAGGLMFALSLDYRIMARGKSTLKMTELPLGMVLPRGGDIVLTTKLPPTVHRDLVLKGKSFSCEEGLSSSIIDELVEPQDLMRRARELANELSALGDKKDVYMCVKKSMYYDSIETSLEAKYSRAEWKAMGEEEPKL